MPTLNQYKALSLGSQAHTFCSAVIFFSLLEKFNDAEQFAAHFTLLFGEQGMMAKFSRLQDEIEQVEKIPNIQMDAAANAGPAQ